MIPNAISKATIIRTELASGGSAPKQSARGWLEESVEMIATKGTILRRVIGFFCFMALAFGALTQVRADQTHSTGNWQQIVSNAGQCDHCQIAIEQQGSVLRITSSNGWFAVVDVDQSGASETVSGIGRWKPGHGGVYSSAPFTVDFTMTNGQLYMNMSVPDADKRTRVIKAIFDKLPSTNSDRGSSIKA